MKNKKIVIAATVIIILLVGLLGIKIGSQNADKKTVEQEIDSVLPDSEVIPTVDDSVEVEVSANSAVTELTLTISNFPDGTDVIEYELAYETESGLLQGIPGTIKNVSGKKSITRSGLTLGTCSSGTCKYDRGVNAVTATIKFVGDYGSKIFEKEFQL